METLLSPSFPKHFCIYNLKIIKVHSLEHLYHITIEIMSSFMSQEKGFAKAKDLEGLKILYRKAEVGFLITYASPN